ncbi:MAG: DUF1801 domain-containing protein [Phycisphaerales bacterium]|nr:DUF1801 domain-containing protein [Phycisphaerales bacterium]
MPTKPTTVTQYLAALPKDRRDELKKLRQVVRANLDPGYKEGMQYGMPGWFVPHSVYPAGYHCDPAQPLPFAGMASQKNHMSLYLCGLYYSEEEMERIRTAWKKTGRRLDMGKSCIRFKTIDDLPLDLIGKLVKRMTVKRHVALYEQARAEAGRKSAERKKAKKKTTGRAAATRKKAPTKKTTTTKKRRVAKR